jgi:hypothetical protein
MIEDSYAINSVDDSRVSIKLNTTTEGVPTFLKNQMTITEKSSILNFFSNLFCISSKQKKIQDINDEELEVFYELKNLAFTNYDENDSNHEQSLRFLYLSTIKGDLTNDLITDEWKIIGFETNNPRNEFQDGGYLSLLFINFFVKFFSDEFQEIMNYNKANPKIIFRLGKCAIILSSFCKLSLGQFYTNSKIKNNSTKSKMIKPVNIKQFTSFMKQQNNDRNFIYRLLSIILMNTFTKERNRKTLSKSDEEILKDSFNESFYNELDLYNIDDEIKYSNESVNSSFY